MVSKYWIKLYHEILYDRKSASLDDRLWRRMIECFLFAGELDNNGHLPAIEDMSWTLRITEEELETDLIELQRIGILAMQDNQWYVTNFSKRQAPTTSTERTRRQRERDTKAGVEREYWQKSKYENLPELPGVYRLICTETERSYIGASKNIKNRVRGHLTVINTGQHPMSTDFATYGKDTIEIEVLELVDDTSKLPAIEDAWIKKYPIDDLYNEEPSGKRHREWEIERTRDAVGTTRPTDKIRRDTDTDKKQKRIEPEEGVGGAGFYILDLVGLDYNDADAKTKAGILQKIEKHGETVLCDLAARVVADHPEIKLGPLFKKIDEYSQYTYYEKPRERDLNY